jgi:manganese/zinc/iron transport system permease protein
MLKYNTLIVLAGVSLLGASAGMVGAFAVLRKRALTGDALSHAALPGLCLAFLFMRERNVPAMLLGALASGVAGIMIISALRRWTRVREDAAIGSVLTVFFGAGIALLAAIQKMEGLGSKAGLDSYIFGKTAGMVRDDVVLIFLAGVLGLAAVALLYKEFLSISFDTDFARSLGWPVYMLDLLLMSLVALAVVIGLPAVGVVLISALLIMPGAAARFWTDRLSTLLVLSGVFGFGVGLVGTWLSATFDQLPAGPIIVLSGTALFVGSMLFGWKRGVLARWIDQRRFETTLGLRQLLRIAWEREEAEAGPARPFTIPDLLTRKTWAASRARDLLSSAEAAGLVRSVGRGTELFELTPAGREQALAATRGQRLWEAFLAEYPEQANSTANLASLSIEEYVPQAVVEQLTARLQAEGRWPVARGPAKSGPAKTGRESFSAGGER